jgi:hypothetical protein
MSKEPKQETRIRIARSSDRSPEKQGASRFVKVLIVTAVSILLVTVLYFVLLQLYGPHPAPSSSVAFREFGASQVGSSHFVNLSLNVTGQVSTYFLGFKIATPLGGITAPSAAGGQCLGPLVSNCTAPPVGWFAVLADRTGHILATFDVEGWPGVYPVVSGEILVLVSPNTLAGSGDILSAFSYTSTVVTGAVTL